MEEDGGGGEGGGRRGGEEGVERGGGVEMVQRTRGREKEEGGLDRGFTLGGASVWALDGCAGRLLWTAPAVCRYLLQRQWLYSNGH